MAKPAFSWRKKCGSCRFPLSGHVLCFPQHFGWFPLWSGHLREVSLQLRDPRLNILWGLGSTDRQLGLSVFLLLHHRHHDELSSAKAHGLENKVLDCNMPHKMAWPKSGAETWKHWGLLGGASGELWDRTGWGQVRRMPGWWGVHLWGKLPLCNFRHMLRHYSCKGGIHHVLQALTSIFTIPVN